MKLTFLLTCLLQRGKNESSEHDGQCCQLWMCRAKKHACFLIVRQQIAKVGNTDNDAVDI